MRKVILVDQDEVLAEFLGGLCKELNRVFKSNLKKEDFSQWDLEDVLEPKMLEYVYNNPDIFERLDVIKDAQKYLKLLSNDYDIYIVTAAYWNTVTFKVNWIKKHFPFIPEENIIISRSKFMVRGDIIIDDNTKTMEDCLRYNQLIQPILMSAPHNLEYRNDFVPRCGDWEEIYEYIINS